MLQFFDDSVPRHASVALALSDNGFGYPFFGPHLTRRVELVPAGSNGDDTTAEWLYADANRSEEPDQKCWTAEVRSERGTVFRRAGSCA